MAGTVAGHRRRPSAIPVPVCVKSAGSGPFAVKAAALCTAHGNGSALLADAEITQLLKQHPYEVNYSSVQIVKWAVVVSG